MCCMGAGNTTRLCLPTGVWDDVDISNCARQDFPDLDQEVRTRVYTE